MNPGLLVLICAAAFLAVIAALAFIQELHEAKEKRIRAERAEREERRKAAQESAKEIFYVYLEVITNDKDRFKIYITDAKDGSFEFKPFPVKSFGCRLIHQSFIAASIRMNDSINGLWLTFSAEWPLTFRA